MKKLTYDAKLPEWSLCYLINNDPFESGTSEQNERDKRECDKFMQFFYDEADKLGGSIYISILNNEPYFSAFPSFGLSDNVNDCEIIILY